MSSLVFIKVAHQRKHRPLTLIHVIVVLANFNVFLLNRGRVIFMACRSQAYKINVKFGGGIIRN